MTNHMKQKLGDCLPQTPAWYLWVPLAATAAAGSVYFVLFDQSLYTGLLNSIKHPVFSLVVFVFVALACWLIGQVYYYLQWRYEIRHVDGSAARSAFDLALIRSAGTLGTADQIPARDSLRSLRDDMQDGLSQRWAYVQLGSIGLLFLWVILFAIGTVDNDRSVLPSDSLKTLVIGIGSTSVLFLASLVLSMLSAGEVKKWYHEMLVKTGCELHQQLPLADNHDGIEDSEGELEKDPFATFNSDHDDSFMSSNPEVDRADELEPFGSSASEPDGQSGSRPFENSWDESPSSSGNPDSLRDDNDAARNDDLKSNSQSDLKHKSSGDPTDSIF